MMMMSFISRPPPCRYVPSHVRAEPFLVLLLLELVLVFSIVVLLFLSGGCSADIIFSEIADQGTTSSAYCAEGQDWLELHNTYTASFYLSGLILHDNHGVNDTDHAFTFPPGQRMAPGEYLVLCMEGTNDPLTSPQFKIGGSDTITLFNPFTQQIAASIGPLPDGAERAFDVTYAWNNNLPIMSQSSSYMYTKTPTPGSANILTKPIIMNDENNETTTAQIKRRLKLQNALGTQFFGMDDNGLPVPERLDDVLDLHLSMEQADYEYLMQNASFQLHSPFTSARVTRNNSNTDVQEDLLVLNSPGRIRAKGQSSLNIAQCMRQKLPFVVEFNTVNKTQALFGVEKIYLRTHFLDSSYMRDWSAHRMLARFGLPHLRARKMRLYINGKRIGLYTVLEAAEQEYVFARSFPNYTPDSYALYKVKTLSIGCGRYEPEQLEKAQLRLDGSSTPPYAFERGDHRAPVTVRGPDDHDACYADFVDDLFKEYLDVQLAYLRHNQDCGEMVVKEGLVDLDLGVKDDWDSSMIQFFNSHLGKFKCDDEECQNSNLSGLVDIENFLKSFAFYAVTVQMDSPLGNGNNYYLAETVDDTGWKIVGYDHNHVGGNTCGHECNAHLPSWSILRPTCGPLHQTQLAGPLLSNATLHAQYIEYVRAFTNEVLGNVSFVEEMTNHLQAIQDYVMEDYRSEQKHVFTAKPSPNASDWKVEYVDGGQFFIAELSPNASDWDNDGIPLIPFYRARVEEVRRQLESLDNGIIPRKVEPFEVCVDWSSTEPPQPSCTQACRYEGCHDAGLGLLFILYCDEVNGVCYHGEKDPLCEGIPNGERYDGMENKKDGRGTVCGHFIGFEAVKMYECPPFVVDDEATPSLATTGAVANNEMVAPEITEEGGQRQYETLQENDGSSTATSHGKLQGFFALVAFVFSWFLFI